MRIIVSDKLDNEAIAMLNNFCDVDYQSDIGAEELMKKIGDYDGIVVRSRTKVTREIIKAGKNLKVIGRAGVGVDNIDVDFATERKIPVVFSPGGSTQSVVELAIGLIVTMGRDICNLNSETHNGKWLKGKVEGMELNGKVLGIYGLGRIGKELARISAAMGLKVCAYDPFVETSPVATIYKDFHEFLSSIDLLSIHALLNDQTRHSISTREFEVMRKGVLLLNLSRGEIIDEKALIEALKTEKIKAVALDVYEQEPPVTSPLRNFKNVIMLPHIGAATKEAQKKSGTMIAQEVITVLSGRRSDNCVNRSVFG